MELTAIFDIGKTNKKFFLFDASLNQVHAENMQFPPVPDLDGYPSDDLAAILQWLRQRLGAALRNPDWDIVALNFSTYGASLVFTGADGQPVFPFVNYTKPYPREVQDGFDALPETGKDLARRTASPRLGMLNAGLQAYWLKMRYPEVFHAARYAFHFPQYLSYLFTGVALSDFTSVGCHTALWDFDANTYHAWVGATGTDRLLPPLVARPAVFYSSYQGRPLRVGSGLHDSSAALLPYLMQADLPFVLLSTGTWSIAMNPFSTDPLTEEELALDCLSYLRPDGKPVKASRLFLGNEHQIQIARLCEAFHLQPEAAHTLAYDPDFVPKSGAHFYFETLTPVRPKGSGEISGVFSSFKEAYHQLMSELMELQIQSIRRAAGQTAIRRLYVDGGFAGNTVFTGMLQAGLPEWEVRPTPSPLGSALGAAMALTPARREAYVF